MKIIKKMLNLGLVKKLVFLLTSKLKISGRKNITVLNRAIVYKSSLIVRGNSNIIKIGTKSRILNLKLSIKGSNNKILIGENVLLNDTEIIVEDNNNLIKIGDFTTVFGSTHLACIEGTSISIGYDCMFSKDITIRTGDSHSITNLDKRRINISKSVEIGNHVWIGNKVIILKGSNIQNDSIVGSGSLVASTFINSNVIIGGNKAKVIKENIMWFRERF